MWIIAYKIIVGVGASLQVEACKIIQVEASCRLEPTKKLM